LAPEIKTGRSKKRCAGGTWWQSHLSRHPCKCSFF